MAQPLRIAVGADHGGYELKHQLVAHFRQLGHEVEDCGTFGKEPVDYPRIAGAVAELVASGRCRFGVMVDGAGIGSAMAANKVPGVLAAACYNEELARNSREHNDANVLTLGAGQVDLETAKRISDVFLTTACTVDRHRRRVAMIREMERGGGRATNSAAPTQLDPDDFDRIAARVRALLAQRGAGALAPPVIPPDQLAKLIDHTLLKPEATPANIEQLCAEARRYGFFSVCVNPSYVKQAHMLLTNTPIKVCCVVGFPLGAQPAEIKALEARRAIREGAKEIDMVINVGALKGRDDEVVRKDVRGVVEACKDGRALCKVILETALLTDEEKVRGCEHAMRAGANFVKTSTGFSRGGATVEDVTLMSRTVAAKKLGVKASGGIRTLADVVKMIQAGATRVGCSNSVRIMEEALAQGGRKE
jgi:deoxyribose-phosphate aldolase